MSSLLISHILKMPAHLIQEILPMRAHGMRIKEPSIALFYLVMDADDNLYTVIAFTGDKDTKDQVIDTFRTVKYKDKQLYTN